MKSETGGDTPEEASPALDVQTDSQTGGDDTSWVVSDRYIRGSHLYSTRTSDGFEAVETSSGDKVLLWLLRFPLESSSDESVRFVERLSRIKELMVPTPRFRSFGLDSSGNAYLVTDHVIGKYALDSVESVAELESLFIQCLKALVPLHLAGVSLEDLSSDTFVTDSSAKVLVLPLLGSFESGAKQTAMLPPSETLHYLAPEQRMGSRSDIAADMYALGVFGYRLFTGRYLHGDKPIGSTGEDLVATAPAPSALKAESPLWLDDVLGRCLEQDPSKRFRDASEVLEVIDVSVEQGVPPGGSSSWSQRTTIVSAETVKNALEAEKQEVKVEEVEEVEEVAIPEVEVEQVDAPVIEEIEPEAGPRVSISDRINQLILPLRRLPSTMLIWSLAIIIGVAGSAFLFSSISSWDSSDSSSDAKNDLEALQNPIAVHVDYAPEELKPYIIELVAEETTVLRKVELLGEIAASDDPTAYGVLIATLKSGKDRELVIEAQKLLLDRVKAQELTESSEILDSWFDETVRLQKTSSVPAAYGLLLRACDRTRPLSTRKNALQQAFSAAPTTTTQLAAALAIDESQEQFVPVLRKFLAGDIPKAELEGKGLGSLLFSSSSLRRFLQDDASNVLKKFSDKDLRDAMEEIAKPDSPYRSTSLLFSIAAEVHVRAALSPYRMVFVQALVDNGPGNTEAGIRDALLRAAIGKTTLYDVQQIARWRSVSVDSVLLGVCVSVEDPQIASEAFDILASRDVQTEPARSLLLWLRSRYWDYRAQAVRPIAILGLVEVAPREDVQKAFEALLPYSKGGLFSVMANSGNTLLQMEAVERLGAITSSGELVGLLDSDDKDIRMAIVQALAGRNELVVLRAVLRAYKHEQDEDVRKAFRESHWVTRDRKSEMPQREEKE